MRDFRATRRATLVRLRRVNAALSVWDEHEAARTRPDLFPVPEPTLKIDRAFVAPTSRNGQATAIVRAAAALAHALGMNVTAEGIETAEQWSRVRSAGCDHGQGYYFARPLLSEPMSALLASAPPWGVP